MTDTIIAQSTPYGRSGVGILRISGSKVQYIANKVLGTLPSPRYAYYSSFLDSIGDVIDQGLAIWFPKPNSFTGEDVLELHGHGNPVILDLLIKSILSFGNIRIARPGEFSERAFLNGKLDLIQAESIIKLINANSEFSIKSSLKSLQGVFSKKINNLINNIINVRMLIETILNFPDEDYNINFYKIKKKIEYIFNDIKKINIIAKSNHTFRERFKFVIVGPTNVGKSSIFNLLSLNDSAIVTNISGTTRDVLNEFINIKGITIQITDTAGFRLTNNIIEKIGINKSWEQIKISDHIFFVLDDTFSLFKKKKIIVKFLKKITHKDKVTFIINKCDLSNRTPQIKKYYNNHTYIIISAKKKYGFKLLKKYLKKLIFQSNHDSIETIFLVRRRHLNILRLIKKQIKYAKINCFILKNIELLAEDLKIIQNMLNEITGSVTSNDILNSIFKNFCIGK
ncbi:tRNA uridine-5-carboxymethylaminomethyl(34) synthesis GTPase MnmE [Buchnera aphidicola]|uniref:tRNA modification GTPase MnmE n=1 Tax=Buchnera aphidicola (Therioaphis trifolii) TaxID=1241884 RepID=A0A4D6YMM4_9GAMM|nr:tRNA uridine-5-carboxymethylaminomethyl(34) synthesis GTPase MnmE [Buchnera aphidicola]QCI27028.1 tRNA uridine-5-carboxymethylaminomethyl(34) synthesis GTPase MnmE [Buchnera aphidicola (Therioaphis trifolii)]